LASCPNNCSNNPITNFASAQAWIATVNANSAGEWTYNVGIVPGTESQYSATATSTSVPINNTSEILPCREICSDAVAPVLISSSQTNICSGDNIVLNANGGSGNRFAWYTGSCGGTLVGIGTSLTVTNLVSTTTFFGRWEAAGNCQNSSCLQITITVTSPPNTNSAVSALGSPLCAGTNGTVRVVNSQVGVSYQLFIGSVDVGLSQEGNGGNLDMVVPSGSLGVGNNRSESTGYEY